MAQFRATIDGSRGSVSRLGHKNTGIVTQTNGWGDGVKVHAYHDKPTDSDVFVIWATKGSNARSAEKCLGTLRGGVWEPATSDSAPDLRTVCENLLKVIDIAIEESDKENGDPFGIHHNDVMVWQTAAETALAKAKEVTS